jgi:two-component system response regulator ResD
MEELKVLIVDDEEGIRDLIKEYMSMAYYQVTEAADGVEALNRFRGDTFDVVILDVMLPKMDGWKVCEEIRKESSVPIIMLTARGEEYDRLLGFEMGVDDYMVKPFSPRELMARIRAVLSRARSAEPVLKKTSRVEMEKLMVDFDGRSVSLDGRLLSLTPKEYELLSFFVKNPNKAFSREQLLTSVWGYDFMGDDRTVDSHVKQLREHLGSYRKWIVTVWGTGYKFVPQVAE